MHLTQEELVSELMKNILYQVITGSTSYGLNTKNSDVDEKSIASLPKHLFYTLGQDFETIALHEPKDFEIHSMKKFFNLLCNQNPTITEMIWIPEKFILKNSKYGQLLRDNRELFLCKEAYHAFGGYAKQQLMRIKGGLDKLTVEDKIDHLDYTAGRMIADFPRKYSQAESGIFLLNEVTSVEEGKQNLDLQVHFNSISLTQLNGMISELAQTVKTYNKMGKRNNKPTDKLFKHAMHLLRLLITGIEVLETGILQVERTDDRAFLLDVRNEKYTWDEVFEMVRHYQEKLDYAYAHTHLPDAVDTKRIQELYTDIMIDLLAS